MKFIVRQKSGNETSHPTVQEAFAKGGALTQDVNVNPSNAKYPLCLIEDNEGRRYGPVLRP